jgi:hypothetical protein
MAIDNRLEKIRNIANEEDSEVLSTFIQAGGVLSPIFAVLAAVKGVIDFSEVKARIRIAILSLCDELEQISDTWPTDVESALKSVSFKKAVQVLIEESLRAPNDERAALLARAAAHGCFPSGENKHRQEDLAIYIHDLAQLGVEGRVAQVPGEVSTTTEDGCPRCLAFGHLG